jgi:hypothetical protein
MDHYWSFVVINDLLAKQNRDLYPVVHHFSSEVVLILVAPLIVFLGLIAIQSKYRGKLIFTDFFSYQKPTKFGFLQQYLPLPVSFFVWSIVTVILVFYFLEQPTGLVWSKASFLFALLPVFYYFWLLLAINSTSFITGINVFRRPLLVTTMQMFFIIVLILSVATVINMSYPNHGNIVQASSAVLISFVVLQRLIKSFWVCLTNRISLYYLILYLCALEIAPLLFIYRKIAIFESD